MRGRGPGGPPSRLAAGAGESVCSRGNAPPEALGPRHAQGSSVRAPDGAAAREGDGPLAAVEGPGEVDSPGREV